MYPLPKPLLEPLFSIAVMALAAGCSSQPTTSYPTTPQNTTPAYVSSPSPPAPSPAPAVVAPAPAPTAPPLVVQDPNSIPASAQLLSESNYPPASFVPPTKPGLFYIYDLDTKMIVAKTNNVPDGSGAPISLADRGNVSRSLNVLHKYQVYFVPEEKPSTMP